MKEAPFARAMSRSSAGAAAAEGKSSSSGVKRRRKPMPLKVSKDYNAAEVLKGLFLGGKELSQDCDRLKELGITHILNVTTESPNHFTDEFTYLQLPIKDSPEEDLSESLRVGTEFIGKARSEGILVHCTVGMSRSAAFVLGYLMVAEKMSLKDAFVLLKRHRPITSPNKVCLMQVV